jgi:hypothetical protein
VTFRGLDLTSAPRVSDPKVLQDLEMARRNDAIKAAGGEVREATQAAVVYKSPEEKAPGQEFVVFHDAERRVFYILVTFKEVGKRIESQYCGPFEGDPFQKLGLPAPPGEPDAREETKEAPTARPRSGPYRVEPFDLLRISASGTLVHEPIWGIHLVEPSGRVALGPSYGRGAVKGRTVQEAEAGIQKHLRKVLPHPEVSVTLAGW